MGIRGPLSFCLSLGLVGFAPLDVPASDLRTPLVADTLPNAMALGIDEYESARSEFAQKGPQALVEYLGDSVTANDRAFLITKLKSLRPLPSANLVEGKYLEIDGQRRAELLAIRDGLQIKIANTVIVIKKGVALEAMFGEIDRALNPAQISWLKKLSHTVVPEAHAISVGTGALVALGVLIVGWLGYRNHSNYTDKKRSETSDAMVPEGANENQIRAYRQQHGLSEDGSRDFSTYGNITRGIRNISPFGKRADEKLSKNFDPGGPWANEIGSAIRELGPQSRLLSNPPPDVVSLCPGFAKLSQDSKIILWTSILDAMAMSESSHDPSVTFPTGVNVISRGLLQISWASARGHGARCRNVTGDSLHNPIVNLGCGVKILEDNLRKRSNLFSDETYYWSVVRPNKDRAGYKRLMNRLNTLKANPQRWPAGCNAT